MDIISFVFCLFRSASFLAMEVFCANSVIWHYDWSSVEKHVHITLIVLYFCFSIASMILSRTRQKTLCKRNAILSVAEGAISVLIISVLLSLTNADMRMTPNAWLTLNVQIPILLINTVSFCLQRKCGVVDQ